VVLVGVVDTGRAAWRSLRRTRHSVCRACRVEECAEGKVKKRSMSDTQERVDTQVDRVSERGHRVSLKEEERDRSELRCVWIHSYCYKEERSCEREDTVD